MGVRPVAPKYTHTFKKDELSLAVFLESAVIFSSHLILNAL